MVNYIQLPYVSVQPQNLSKNKKGFSLIEAICGIAVVSIFIVFLFPAMADYQKLKINNDKYNKYFCFIEAVKNNLYYNCDKNQIDMLNNSGKVYINSEYVDIDKIKNDLIACYFSNEHTNKNPYLKMEINKDSNNVFKIKLELHYTTFSRDQIITCEFYKGDY